MYPDSRKHRVDEPCARGGHLWHELESMPELERLYGDLLAIGAKVLIGGALALLFRLLRWR